MRQGSTAAQSRIFGGRHADGSVVIVLSSRAQVSPVDTVGLRRRMKEARFDSAFIDPTKYFALVKEHEIGYFEANASQIKFYLNHFSGYLVSCGFKGQ